MTDFINGFTNFFGLMGDWLTAIVDSLATALETFAGFVDALPASVAMVFATIAYGTLVIGLVRLLK